MKKVELIETLDGKLHRTTEEAKTHLNKLLEDVLGKQAYYLQKPGKKTFDEVFEYLRLNLSQFVLAADIIEDLELIEED